MSEWAKNERFTNSLICVELPEWFCLWSLIFGERPERITHDHSFLVSDLSDLLTLLILVSDLIKHTKNMILDFFSQNCLSESLIRSFIMSNQSKLLICHDQPERFSHGRSFVLSDRAIRSQSLIFLEQSEWIAHSCSFDLSEMSEWANEQWANEQWANERIPSPIYL